MTPGRVLAPPLVALAIVPWVLGAQVSLLTTCSSSGSSRCRWT